MVREIEEARNYARGLIECSPDMMLTIDRDGVIMDVNEEAVRWTSRTRKELVGSRFASHFTDPSRAEEGIALTFGSGRVSDYRLDLRLEDGSKPEVVPLPMPSPVFFDGYRLPASYANFYISTAAVIVPTFNDPNDRVALGILGELFRDRPVIGIHAVDLVLGFGTLHCLTQQQPAA